MENNEQHKDKDGADIIVNGVSENWERKKINYEQVVKLAFPDGPTGGNIRYSVTWTKPDGQEGSMRPGSGNEDVVDGMIFDVRNTDKS
jgi:predicted enzyme related to lactoylglutathione lyase